MQNTNLPLGYDQHDLYLKSYRLLKGQPLMAWAKEKQIHRAAQRGPSEMEPPSVRILNYDGCHRGHNC